ncbi:primosomal protein [Kineococcus aurantiacus]|uniref:Ran GTPase-activating protein (RanGAP) involved in mRNA processing and transport n=1 Tax=Kineococcus aurantiacus TaxID=37633 RepID=A0A7Y9DJF1_9ACTN|nr:primosomal protein [Kineococcus aurantiacus]NYD20668.1 Ran GTPase-activating protein (RanGAP) involved in mRNA processing and transport [Kineococcus aurantiacus]
MTPDPRAALARLVATLEDHLAAAANRRGETDPAVADAYQRVADAFEAYEEALYDAYDEVTPFVLYDDVEDERDDDEEEDDEDDDESDDESDAEDDEDENDDEEDAPAAR